MRREQKTSAELVVLKLRQIDVQTAQGKSLALACKEAEISEQSCATSAHAKRSSTRREKYILNAATALKLLATIHLLGIIRHH